MHAHWKNNLEKVLKNLAKYRSENNFFINSSIKHILIIIFDRPIKLFLDLHLAKCLLKCYILGKMILSVQE